MPLLRSSFFLFLFLVTAISAQPLNNSFEQKILNAIESENYIFIEPFCDEGKDIMDYAIENKSIHAQAQLIIIRA